MSTFNRSIPLLGLFLCGLVLSGPASAEIKMGYVNFQKLLEDAPQTKTAMQGLENEFAPRRRELLTMQNDLKARDEKLQKEGAVMAEADRQKAEKALRDQQREFSRKAGEFQDDASTRRNEEIGKVQRAGHRNPGLRQFAGLRPGARRRRVLRQAAARHHGECARGARDPAGNVAGGGSRGAAIEDSTGGRPGCAAQDSREQVGACLTSQPGS